VTLSEIKRRQKCLDDIQQEGEVLKPLVQECVNNDSAMRPTIMSVCERIRVSKDAYKKESSQDNMITLYQIIEQLKSESEQKEQQVSKKDEENDQLK